MANAAEAVYLKDGALLQNIQNVSIEPEGMDSERIRGINASKKPLGWRHAQEQGYDISFETIIETDGAEVDWRAEVLKEVHTVHAAAGGAVGDPVAQCGDIATEAAVEEHFPIAAEVEARAEAWAQSVVVGHGGAVGVLAVVAVVAQAEAEGELVGDPPGVVDEQGVRCEGGAEARVSDRLPDHQRRTWLRHQRRGHRQSGPDL